MHLVAGCLVRSGWTRSRLNDVQKLKHRLRQPRAQDGEQRVDGLERALEEGSRVGRDRTDAVHDPVAASSEAVDGLLRLRRSTSGCVEAAKSWDQRRIWSCCSAAKQAFVAAKSSALEWSDVDLASVRLCIQRSEWRGHVTVPKGGRLRYVPMTTRLAAALRRSSSPEGACECFVCDDGSPLTQEMVGESRAASSRRKAGVPASGAHRLRHTFCSHLAMRGAPARAIQELAGHQDLTTTQRYMHLSPAALEARFDCWIIRFSERGDILETAEQQIG